MKTGTRLASVLLGLVLVIAALAYLLPQRERRAAANEPATPGDTAAAPATEAASLTVYFSRGETAAPVSRPAPGTQPGPEAALRELLRGPTQAEQAGGISSWFSPETADMLKGFAVDDSGVAHVDFADLRTAIPSASSSAGSTLLLRELNQTLFQYPEIRAIEYTIDGSCEAFWNWLQYDCEIVRREDSR